MKELVKTWAPICLLAFGVLYLAGQVGRMWINQEVERQILVQSVWDQAMLTGHNMPGQTILVAQAQVWATKNNPQDATVRVLHVKFEGEDDVVTMESRLGPRGWMPWSREESERVVSVMTRVNVWDLRKELTMKK